jgi:hypothetical protein
MKRIITTTLFLVAALVAFSQNDTTYWRKGGMLKADFAQNSFTNWGAGGINSVAINSMFSTFLNYKRNNLSWDNTLDLGYGLIRQKPSRDSVSLIKSDDKIDFNSKFGLLAWDKWYYSGFLNFKTQFDEGYKYPDNVNKISTFMAPAYLIFGVGMDYKPNPNFNLLLSPVTGKMTFVLDDSLSARGEFGVHPGHSSRTELGGFVKIAFKRNLFENVSFQTKIDLFSNYLHNPQNVDVNWEALIAMKVNKYISATIGTQLIYDDDIMIKGVDKEGNPFNGPRLQFKEVFGVGLSYKF